MRASQSAQIVSGLLTFADMVYKIMVYKGRLGETCTAADTLNDPLSFAEPDLLGSVYILHDFFNDVALMSLD